MSPIEKATCSHQQELVPSGRAGMPRCPHQPTLGSNLIGCGLQDSDVILSAAKPALPL